MPESATGHYSAFFDHMKIYIHHEVYRRTQEYAKAQGKSVSKFVQDALKQLLGLEGLPLDDEDVFGREKKEEEKE